MSRFSYVRYDDHHAMLQQNFKEKFEGLEALANDVMPEGRCKSLFMTKLEEAYMWTGKAIRDSQIEVDGKVVEQAERGNE
jgi:hypothetical protein